MRIAVASLDYPPASTEGVARQRRVLAEGLVELGHEVHVVTSGARTGTVLEGGVHVHRYHAGDAVNAFEPSLPVLDRPLTDAQLLCEGVLDLARSVPVDVVDVPLWLAQPFALVRHAPCPVVVWLQTTLLQLVELQHRSPRPHEEVLAGIDRHGLMRAAACIADSASIIDEIDRLYDVPGLRDRTTVVHPGVPSIPPPVRRSGGRRGFEILVVGRLEQRKGTAELFEMLPRLLAEVPGSRVRFVGRDNSRADGFFRATGQTYPEAFIRRCPDLQSRVVFDGYVDEAAMAECYTRADLLLHPAHYESFGLIFLEAMRASLPVVTYRTGGAIEVFAGDGPKVAAAGADLCRPHDAEALVDAVVRLARDPEHRVRLGEAGRKAFDRRFTSDRMARETADVYAGVIPTTPVRRAAPRPPRLFQMTDALQDRDAVSRIARANAPVLADLGGELPIMAVFADERVRREAGRLRGARFRPGDTAIFHYWGFSRLERVMRAFPGRAAIHYHHIAPPSFFAPRSPHYEMARRGYAQLDRIADDFDLVLGDSMYDLAAYARHLTAPRPTLCLYPAVDAEALASAPWDREFAACVARESDGPVWLFVGRFAPNERQDQVMMAFDRFVDLVGRGRLLLVGDMTSVPAYVAALEARRDRLAHGDRVMFVPSASDDALRACYRSADVFACASEHEGFCVPVAEAMAFGVPTVVLDRGAIGETVGGSGVVLDDWEAGDVALQVADLLESDARRRGLAAAQRSRLRDFSPSAVRERLRAAAAFLRDDLPSPLFVLSHAFAPAGHDVCARRVPVWVASPAGSIALRERTL